MSKTGIIFVTIGTWVICCALAAFYCITSMNLSSITLGDKFTVFAFFNFPYWVIALIAIVSLEISVLKPFYQKLNTSFVIGFIGGLIFYFVTTDHIDKSNHTVCADCVERFGFPFHYLETQNYFSAPAGILWFGLIADILIALIFSFVLGLLSKSVWSILRSRLLDLK